ncbi:MAG TPA: adenylate/guanylate cyclase domain-containing protein [Candidatus Limnocylindrales bacterium]|nr:adenylate/guanylate cyclase domain-containing protein [Candidatus Limnocylindrales bacterium]
MIPRPSNGSPTEPHDGGPLLTAEQISAVERFPDDNPNPVLRIDGDGHLVYANPASSSVVTALGGRVGERLPDDALERLTAVASSQGFIEVVAENRTYAVWPVPIAELGFTNLYGMDVTAERAIVKFPDQNPNPVLRIDWQARLVYANQASETIVSGLDLALGRPLPADLGEALRDAARADERETIEIEAGGHAYALLPVDIPEFGFINVYGTDVTAVRERERLARENERLLLNVLPEPIARRLRDGEPLIADRFDDVTLLFADIVDFTRLSSELSATELVGVLNEVFTVFDGLVERYGLEKVKTIGDAYMVVGGMDGRSPDHTARVAAMAIELADAVGQIATAVRLGIRFRIGMHCGAVVAGVIGTKKFIYDIWGDTVNLASRMESHGVPGRVQATHEVVRRLEGIFQFEARGLIDVKGKGPTPAYLLVGHAPRPPAGRT